MPRSRTSTPASKAKPNAKATPKQKVTPKPKATPKSDSKGAPKSKTEPEPDTPSPTQAPRSVDKKLVLAIILAKLESVKTCDWHALSLRLEEYAQVNQVEDENDYDVPRGNGKRKAGPATAKAKSATTAAQKRPSQAKGPTGSELHDMYHNVILPALQEGRTPWRENDVESSSPAGGNEGGPSTVQGATTTDAKESEVPAKKRKTTAHNKITNYITRRSSTLAEDRKAPSDTESPGNKSAEPQSTPLKVHMHDTSTSAQSSQDDKAAKDTTRSQKRYIDYAKIISKTGAQNGYAATAGRVDNIEDGSRSGRSGIQLETVPTCPGPSKMRAFVVLQPSNKSSSSGVADKDGESEGKETDGGYGVDEEEEEVDQEEVDQEDQEEEIEVEEDGVKQDEDDDEDGDEVDEVDEEDEDVDVAVDGEEDGDDGDEYVDEGDDDND